MPRRRGPHQQGDDPQRERPLARCFCFLVLPSLLEVTLPVAAAAAAAAAEL